MNRTQAGLIVGRLAAQWPSIADTDLGADDWINTVCGLSYEQGQAVAGALLNGWTRDRPPRLADWQESARQLAVRRQLEESQVPALDAPAGPKAKVDALLAEMRDVLSTVKTRRCSCVGCERRRSGAVVDSE